LKNVENVTVQHLLKKRRAEQQLFAEVKKAEAARQRKQHG
jgi:hypothetical protein